MFVAVGALLALAGPGPVSAQADSSLAIRAVRFYGPEARQTRVTAFVRIPYGSLEPTQPADGSPGSLRFALTVRVSTVGGGVLYEQNWRKQVPPPVPGRMNGLDMIRFALDAGTYLVEALVEDSVSGRTERAAVQVVGWPASPGVSDLLLSREIRQAALEDSIPNPGTVRRGNLLLDAAAEVVVSRRVPVLHYLFETYLRDSPEGDVMVRIVDGMGEVVREESAVSVVAPDGMAVFRGQIDVAGLPPGLYALDAAIRFGDRTFLRSAGFAIADIGLVLGGNAIQGAKVDR